MLTLDLASKEHDESRQGEALVLDQKKNNIHQRKLYIESYGCAMNFADSEIVASILSDDGFITTPDYNEADVIFINTCSIRENAETRVRNRLKQFKAIKRTNKGLVIGVLGCMAERLKAKFLEEEQLVDVVVGPDAYRDLPNLIQQVNGGQKAINVLLSREETYADVSPVRLNSNGISAFVSIMRGCDNMCSFCVVPFTRGRERSRDAVSIVKEVQDLYNEGYKEVTLLGQNVDSYKWVRPHPQSFSKGEGSAGEAQNIAEPSAKNSLSFGEGRGEVVNFAQLLEMVALVSPEIRVRFSTSHPKDITDEVLHTIAKYENICNHVHLPVQSGNSRVLDLMNRTYAREWYLNRIEAIWNIIPECSISTDIISGFCTETEEDHQETLSMMEVVKYAFAYMYSYSERPGTPAAKKLADDVPEEEKQRRLAEIIALQQHHSFFQAQKRVGKIEKVLIEGFSKKSKSDFCGRSDRNHMVIFPVQGEHKPGDYVNVLVEKTTTATLIGKIVSV
ncbi:MiaB/RimO family radical SAM methylthiotransferase [Pedobacter cryophilus]|uniref:tRNA-2-methylthio-N(6)-dimethylallyladenosine synthase n=1 Tax=Pedobacter cryophilus TaxID=2571271 RepID=A0A4U1BUT9_9SPHI|nr:MiaB/RimO family radical SAM methylthiotransferase [Pedobacter cryophilus]TKB96211.1 tRNA (N6-isopentenyl adenosine(37)-C2)-methylthiotransferase MiaB [Pedobacter cryophilus]